MMDALNFFFISWVDPRLLMLTAAGTFAGIYIGAIPGLTATMATALLVPITFFMPPVPALPSRTRATAGSPPPRWPGMSTWAPASAPPMARSWPRSWTCRSTPSR